MMKISINEVELKKLGIDVRKDLLLPKLNLDGERVNYPIIVENGQYLVIRGIEKGNIDYLRPKESKIVYYAPYFTWDDEAYEGIPVYSDISSALKSLASNHKLESESEIPVELYNTLKRDFDISIYGSIDEAKKINAYKFKPSEVEKWMVVDPTVKQIALRILKDLNLETKDLEFIEELFSREFKIFAPLKAFLGDVNSIFCSSTLNIGALTGVRLEDINEDTYAVYTKNEEVYILTPQKLDYRYMSAVYEGVSIEKVLNEILLAPVGIEEKDLEVRELRWFKKDTVGITNVLREWREATAYLDLPFYILGAYITRNSIKKALTFLQNNLSTTEREVYKHFRNYVKDTLNSFNLPGLSVEEYFVVLHAGNRSLFPSVPTDYKIMVNSNTVKLDAGIKVLYNGILRAVSDIARTLPLSLEAKEFYETLAETVTGVIIPGISPGKRGTDIYKIAVGGLTKRIKDTKFMPEGRKLDEYNRNVGHVFGRQEPVTISFESGNTKILKEGMVGSVELQWPYKQYAFGFEDSFLVGPYKGINFTGC